MTEDSRENPVQDDTFMFPEQLTIAEAGDYHRLFSSRLQQGGDISVDASRVARIDAAFIQLLFSVQRTLADAGCSLRWTAISPAVCQSVDLLGMRTQLALADDAQGAREGSRE